MNTQPTERQTILETMYQCFNDRDIDGVLTALADDVIWANGMDGGHEHGLAAVRDYWTRQWAVVSPTVRPVSFQAAGDGAMLVTVEQTIRDLAGQPLAGQGHGLTDKMVGHLFHFENGKISRFDIADVGQSR
jgi:hypothetical protein